MPAEAQKWFDRSVEIDAAHPVARSAPLAMYLYEERTTPDGPTLARRLIEEKIGSRQGSRQLVFQTLWNEAVRNDSWDATLELVRDHFPAHFDADGDWGGEDRVTTWFIGAMQFAAGREEQAMRLLQPMLDDSADSRRRYRLGMLHVWNLAATGQRDELLLALNELRESGRAPSNWPITVARLRAFDFVRDEPEFVALLDWLEARSAEQREELRRLLGAEEAKKRGPI